MRLLAEMEFVGNVIDMHPSQNSLYLWTAVSRQRWELQSSERAAQICNTLRAEPYIEGGTNYTHMALDQAYGDLCDSESIPAVGTVSRQHPCCTVSKGRSFPSSQLTTITACDLSQHMFGWVVSSCRPGSYCPSLHNMALYPILRLAFASEGIHSDRPHTLELCSKGHYW